MTPEERLNLLLDPSRSLPDELALIGALARLAQARPAESGPAEGGPAEGGPAEGGVRPAEEDDLAEGEWRDGLYAEPVPEVSPALETERRGPVRLAAAPATAAEGRSTWRSGPWTVVVDRRPDGGRTARLDGPGPALLSLAAARIRLDPGRWTALPDGSLMEALPEALTLQLPGGASITLVRTPT